MNNNQGGQVAVLNAKQWSALEKKADSQFHKTLWAMLRFTGCRSQEVRLLKVENVYIDAKRRVLRQCVFFPAEIRKGGKHSVSVPINAQLRTYLELYEPPESGYLFPSPRDCQKPISYEAMIKYLKEKAIAAGLGHLKIGTHSGRRSLITNLANQGTHTRIIQEITGHRSLASLQRYIEVTDEQKARALESLAFT